MKTKSRPWNEASQSNTKKTKQQPLTIWLSVELSYFPHYQPFFFVLISQTYSKKALYVCMWINKLHKKSNHKECQTQ